MHVKIGLTFPCHFSLCWQGCQFHDLKSLSHKLHVWISYPHLKSQTLVSDLKFEDVVNIVALCMSNLQVRDAQAGSAFGHRVLLILCRRSSTCRQSMLFMPTTWCASEAYENLVIQNKTYHMIVHCYIWEVYEFIVVSLE